MSDIVEELREYAVGSSLPVEQELIQKAVDEIEKLRRDVRTAVMGDSAELQDVKRENEKLRDVLKNCIAALRHAYFHGFTELYKTTADEAAAALWECGE